MDLSHGYVRLYRRLLQNPIWTQLAPAVLKVAIYFLLRANHKPSQWYDGSNSVDIPAGSLITSYAHAAKDCKLSRQQVRDAFDHLFGTHFATYQRTHRWTLVTVLNWSTYQASPDERNTLENTKGNFHGTPDKNIRNKEVNTCASNGDARLGDPLLSIDDPPFGTTEPDAVVSQETAHRAKSSRELTAEQDRWFTAWWAEYWLHKAKKDARIAFRKHVRTKERFQQVMAATRAQKPEMLSREPQHQKHGASWLNGERWEDETTNPAHTAASDDYPELKS